jgi:hypothetical protein
MEIHDLGATLAALKQSVCSAKDLNDPWSRFHDEFAVRLAPIHPGELRPNKRLDQTFAELGERHFRERHPVSDAHYKYIAEHDFWHGYCQVGPRVVIFFEFTAIGVGLAGFMPDLSGHEVVLMRTTAVPLSPGPAGVQQ